MAAQGNNKSSRPKWHFLCVAFVIVTASSIGTTFSVAVGQASQVLAQESSRSLSDGLTSNDAVITAQEEVFPSHVYVVNNREIMIGKPSSQSDQLVKTAEEPFSPSETASRSATIKASVTAASSRLMVVDENDTIVEIWSNTTGTKRSFYSLRVKEQSWQGSEHPLTQTILAQYNRLLGEVDWSINGRAYSAPIY